MKRVSENIFENVQIIGYRPVNEIGFLGGFVIANLALPLIVLGCSAITISTQNKKSAEDVNNIKKALKSFEDNNKNANEWNKTHKVSSINAVDLIGKINGSDEDKDILRNGDTICCAATDNKTGSITAYAIYDMKAKKYGYYITDKKDDNIKEYIMARFELNLGIYSKGIKTIAGKTNYDRNKHTDYKYHKNTYGATNTSRIVSKEEYNKVKTLIDKLFNDISSSIKSKVKNVKVNDPADLIEDENSKDSNNELYRTITVFYSKHNKNNNYDFYKEKEIVKNICISNHLTDDTDDYGDTVAYANNIVSIDFDEDNGVDYEKGDKYYSSVLYIYIYPSKDITIEK